MSQNINRSWFRVVKKSKQFKDLKMQKDSLLLLLHKVFRVILSMIGVEVKQNLKSFSPKVPQMQQIENPRRSLKLQKEKKMFTCGFIHLKAQDYLHQNQSLKKKPKFCPKNGNKGFDAGEGSLRRWKTFHCIHQLNVNGGKYLQMNWKLYCTAMSQLTQFLITVIVWIKFSNKMRLV